MGCGCKSLGRSHQTRVTHRTSRGARWQGLAPPSSRAPARPLGPRTAVRAPRGRAPGRAGPPLLPRPQPRDLQGSRGRGSALPPGVRPARTALGRGAAALGAAPPPAGASRSASRSCRRRAAVHVQGGRREEAREGSGERGGRKARERALLGSRTSQSQPGARTQRLPGPRVPAAPRRSASPGAPRPLPPAAARLGLRPPPAPTRPHPQLPGVTPGTRVLAPSFLPSLEPASLSRSRARVPIVSVPCSARPRLASPCRVSRTS